MTQGTIKIKGKIYPADNVVICFSNGYAKNRPQMFVKCLGVYIDQGNPQWGAIPGTKYFCLHLGARMQAPPPDAPILHLNLTKNWYQMIADGTKTVEYREQKPSWQRIFTAD